MKALKLKDLEKAKNIYNKIKKLDAEILSIEKLANEIITDECELLFALNLTNNTQLQKQKVSFDDDGSLVSRNLELNRRSGLIRFFNSSAIEFPNEPKQVTTFRFEDNDCLKTLQFILNLKVESRQVLLFELGKMGFDVDNLL